MWVGKCVWGVCGGNKREMHAGAGLTSIREAKHGGLLKSYLNVFQSSFQFCKGFESLKIGVFKKDVLLPFDV